MEIPAKIATCRLYRKSQSQLITASIFALNIAETLPLQHLTASD